MKDKIHPKYKEATIECACGNVIQTRSTRGSFKIDICSACHPFYTGKQKLLDTAGRVEKFQRKFGGDTAGDLAAAVAAYYSKARSGGVVPVSATGVVHVVPSVDDWIR